jgi:hypothetical protein
MPEIPADYILLCPNVGPAARLKLLLELKLLLLLNPNPPI